MRGQHVDSEDGESTGDNRQFPTELAPWLPTSMRFRDSGSELRGMQRAGA